MIIVRSRVHDASQFVSIDIATPVHFAEEDETALWIFYANSVRFLWMCILHMPLYTPTDFARKQQKECTAAIDVLNRVYYVLMIVSIFKDISASLERSDMFTFFLRKVSRNFIE